MEISRRQFLKTTSSSLALGAVVSQGFTRPLAAVAQAAIELAKQAPPGETRQGDMLYRTLGRTNAKVSVIGLGGYHIGKQPAEADSIRLIRTAIDRGITFIDNCWDYNNGESELRMGKALRDGYRDKVFLMTKIDG
ncbi:MAG: aldo/keto reductase, partial [Verrucomicrobia bacterium]|nr:aldo/keto reductase [Verrucomicrobiota bacterium]